MSGSSSKFGRFLKSSVNALLNPAEDPRTSYADPTQHQLGLLEQVRVAEQRLAATRAQLELRQTAMLEQRAHLEEEARITLMAGHEDRARLALQRQLIGQTAIDLLDRQIDGLRSEEVRLATIKERLNARIEAIRAREQMAAARHTAARAQIAVGEALSGVDDIDSDSSLIGRIEQDAEELQDRADAIESLISNGVLGATSQYHSISVKSADTDLEERLAALKAAVAAQQPSNPKGTTL